VDVVEGVCPQVRYHVYWLFKFKEGADYNFLLVQKPLVHSDKCAE